MTKRKTGVIKGESNIAYAFDPPPVFHSEEVQNYLEELSEHYLSFLEKESRSPCPFVRFAGIRFEAVENSLVLFVAFCPFEERAYRKAATFLLNEDGTILKIKREKRSRRTS